MPKLNYTMLEKEKKRIEEQDAKEVIRVLKDFENVEYTKKDVEAAMQFLTMLRNFVSGTKMTDLQYTCKEVKSAVTGTFKCFFSANMEMTYLDDSVFNWNYSRLSENITKENKTKTFPIVKNVVVNNLDELIFKYELIKDQEVIDREFVKEMGIKGLKRFGFLDAGIQYKHIIRMYSDPKKINLEKKYLEELDSQELDYFQVVDTLDQLKDLLSITYMPYRDKDEFIYDALHRDTYTFFEECYLNLANAGMVYNNGLGTVENLHRIRKVIQDTSFYEMLELMKIYARLARRSYGSCPCVFDEIRAITEDEAIEKRSLNPLLIIDELANILKKCNFNIAYICEMIDNINSNYVDFIRNVRDEEEREKIFKNINLKFTDLLKMANICEQHGLTQSFTETLANRFNVEPLFKNQNIFEAYQEDLERLGINISDIDKYIYDKETQLDMYDISEETKEKLTTLMNDPKHNTQKILKYVKKKQ